MRTHTFFVAILTFALLIPNASRACSCFNEGPLVAYDRALAVFEGQALEVVPEDTDGFYATHFVVTRVWKGPLEPGATVFTYRNNGANCGFTFPLGEDYLVYGYPDFGWSEWFYEEGALHETSCGRSAPMWWAELIDIPAFQEAGIGAVVSTPDGSWGAIKSLFAGR